MVIPCKNVEALFLLREKKQYGDIYQMLIQKNKLNFYRIAECCEKKCVQIRIQSC